MIAGILAFQEKYASLKPQFEEAFEGSSPRAVILTVQAYGGRLLSCPVEREDQLLEVYQALIAARKHYEQDHQ